MLSNLQCAPRAFRHTGWAFSYAIDINTIQIFFHYHREILSADINNILFMTQPTCAHYEHKLQRTRYYQSALKGRRKESGAANPIGP